MSRRRSFSAASPDRMKPCTRKNPIKACNASAPSSHFSVWLIFATIAEASTPSRRASVGLPIRSLRNHGNASASTAVVNNAIIDGTKTFLCRIK
jgi:hypothetical protein